MKHLLCASEERAQTLLCRTSLYSENQKVGGGDVVEEREEIQATLVGSGPGWATLGALNLTRVRELVCGELSCKPVLP